MVLAAATDAFLAIGAVVIMIVVLVAGAVTMGRHGMFPTEGWSANISRLPPVKRRFEQWNRKLGWGDGVEETTDRQHGG